MAILCRNCHADVTEDYQMAPPKQPFRCKCTSAEFRFVPDTPKVAYDLTPNDERFLRRLKIAKGDKLCGR